MTVVRVETDHDDLSVTLVAEFPVPVDRVWELWADSRKLERWWGPPSYPATFETHDLTPGGEVRYFMIGPDGTKHAGRWRVIAVHPPTGLQFDDMHTDSGGAPMTDVPVTRVTVRIIERDGGTRMEMRSEFTSREQLDRWLSSGTREGIEQAVAQMDRLLRR